jgi:hypothetical protein
MMLRLLKLDHDNCKLVFEGVNHDLLCFRKVVYVCVYVTDGLVKCTLSVWENMKMIVNLIMINKTWLLCFGEIK